MVLSAEAQRQANHLGIEAHGAVHVAHHDGQVAIEEHCDLPRTVSGSAVSIIRPVFVIFTGIWRQIWLLRNSAAWGVLREVRTSSLKVAQAHACSPLHS